MGLFDLYKTRMKTINVTCKLLGADIIQKAQNKAFANLNMFYSFIHNLLRSVIKFDAQ